MTEVWDRGVQNERTRLAWERTMLSGLACSLLVARLLAPSSLVLAIAVGVSAVLSSAVLGWYSTRRYADNDKALHARRAVADARAHLAVTGLVGVTALAAVVYVVVI